MAGAAAAMVVAVASLSVGNVFVGRQRDRAEQNLLIARQVVDEIYGKFAEKLADQKGMDAYQRELHEKALRFYEQFALPQNWAPAVRFEAGKAGQRVGLIQAKAWSAGRIRGRLCEGDRNTQGA